MLGKLTFGCDHRALPGLIGTKQMSGIDVDWRMIGLGDPISNWAHYLVRADPVFLTRACTHMAEQSAEERLYSAIGIGRTHSFINACLRISPV
jgi:hypothetical protein